MGIEFIVAERPLPDRHLVDGSGEGLPAPAHVPDIGRSGAAGADGLSRGQVSGKDSPAIYVDALPAIARLVACGDVMKGPIPQ